MTREERQRRWDAIFDNYDQAIAQYHEQMALTEAGGQDFADMLARLNALMTKWDAQAVAARTVADAVMAANRAAMALYSEEREP